jgi:Sigma-70, region 4.
MTTKEKKEWLKRYGDLDKEINSLLREQESWRALMMRVTPMYSMSAKGSSDPHSKENIIARVAELEDQINAAIDKRLDVRAEINAAIEQVQSDRQRTLLRMRYIEGKKWDDIAEYMHYDIDGRKIFSLHGRALLSLEVKTDT